MQGKSLNDRLMVITGASSGIGLAAAQRGRLVLAARNEEALQLLVGEIKSNGGAAIHLVADVSREADAKRIADAAIARFGATDTWANNAATSIFGKLGEVTLAVAAGASAAVDGWMRSRQPRRAMSVR